MIANFLPGLTTKSESANAMLVKLTSNPKMPKIYAASGLSYINRSGRSRRYR